MKLTAELYGAVLLDDEGCSLHGEPPWDLAKGVEAGVLYVCPITDGSCPNGAHKGGPFLHFADGKTLEDFDRVIFG